MELIQTRVADPNTMEPARTGGDHERRSGKHPPIIAGDARLRKCFLEASGECVYPGEMRVSPRPARPFALAAHVIAGAALAALAPLPGCYINDPLVYTDELADAGADAPADAAPDAAPDAGACSSDAQCDDQSACTVDRCDAGACVHDPAPVDDGNTCTTDACDPATGAVTHAPTPGCLAPISTTGAPSARRLHTAVWTGDRMIVWGGLGSGSPSVTASGGQYDPAKDTWTAISASGAPAPRHSHCAVWTGNRMIVWGGYGATSHETTGGIYDPAADSWSPMSDTLAPTGRIGFSCVWTGQELLVWGGTTGASVLGSGGRYDPATNTWKALPTFSGATPRYGHSAVWTGASMIIWGGNDLFDWHRDGSYYNPSTDAWTGLSPLTGAPAAREQHSALWTGSSMVVWGGFDGGAYRGDGGALDPIGESWVTLSTTGAPSGRTDHAATWTGDRMIVWGGCGTDACKQIYGDGGVWSPGASGGSWTAIVAAAAAEVPARRGSTAVWTGSSALLWGGRTSKGESNLGAVLYP